MQGRGKYNKRRPAKVNTRVERKIIWEIPRLGEQFGDYCKESQIFCQDLLICLKGLYIGV